MIVIPDLLDARELAHVQKALAAADWVDGAVTAGAQSALAKRNSQLPEESAEARALGTIVLDALARAPLFVAAALPLKVYPPLFNRYAGGDAFGDHVDSAVRIQRGSDFRVRSDLSATVFLADPDSYDGGELVVDGRAIKLPAGHMILYPAGSLHHVTPVTRGTRLASFFWIQSMVRDAGARALLLELDGTIQRLGAERGQGDAEIVRLTGVYHNLLRHWSEV
ncbi:Fe2+-dependent dioxygenase [Sphingomonas flavalba]|uniref:Fe2+-dependent dioxygenase n=1 Tax=Sphingomonas flavalba TaxID=2559804 RepID=UPI00109E2255|nr:Fe2+-dependent dioxygenase [Sphingomonas flavalba]